MNHRHMPDEPTADREADIVIVIITIIIVNCVYIFLTAKYYYCCVRNSNRSYIHYYRSPRLGDNAIKTRV